MGSPSRNRPTVGAGMRRSERLTRPWPSTVGTRARARTAVDARSARSHHEKPSVNSGAVLTSRTEAATDVYDRLAIHVAKCRPSDRPEASSTARWRPARAGHARQSEEAEKGATTREA